MLSQQARGSFKGADPAKFKTELCRNWERTGSCSYKNCTFAHGPEELRLPPPPSTTSPQLLPNGINGTSPVTSASGTILAPQQSPLVAPAPAPPLPCPEEVLEMLVREVRCEMRSYATHRETNRALELALRVEQQERKEAQVRVDLLQLQLSELQGKLRAKENEVNYLRSLLSPSSSQTVGVDVSADGSAAVAASVAALLTPPPAPVTEEATSQPAS